MADTLLISRKHITRYTKIGGNVDDDKLIPHMILAEDIFIQNLLGTKLYDKLKTLVAAGTINDPGNAAYKTLLEDWVQKTMCHYVAAEYYLMGAYEVNNMGIIRRQTEVSFMPDYTELVSLEQRARDHAHYYSKRLISFLCDNSSTYPEYNQNQSPDVYPQGTIGRAPFVL